MQLLEQIEKLTLNPKNAARLKELVLDLAVRGKLTEEWRRQNPNMESASILLERIQEEKERLVQGKNIKKDKHLSNIDKGEVPYELPDGWEWCRLGSIGKIVGGGTPKTNNPENYCTEGIPWLTPADLGGYKEKYISKGRRDITRKGLEKSSAQLLPTGSVLFSSRAPIGHLAIAANPIATNQGFKSIVPFISGMNSFIYYFLKNAARKINEEATGTTFKEVSGKEVANILVTLPPLAEQQAIVEIVEQLMQQIEELEQQTEERIAVKEKLGTASLHQLTQAADEESFRQHYAFLKKHVPLLFDNVENIKKLRKSILQLAVQGKLTATWRKQNPDVEPASVLLERIREEKERLVKEKKIKKEKPMSPISEEDLPFELPEGWEWCRLGELAKELTYGTSEKAFEVGQVPVLRMGNISSEGNITYNNLKYVSSEIKDLPRLYLSKHDLVFNRTNSFELVGKCGVYTKEDREYTLASYLIKVSLLPGTDPFYINNYINSGTCRETQIEPQITKQTNQANFSGSKLKDVFVPLPPLGEQQAIVEIVEQLMQLCDALEEQVVLAKEKEESLMQALIHQALEGKAEVPATV